MAILKSHVLHAHQLDFFVLGHQYNGLDKHDQIGHGVLGILVLAGCCTARDLQIQEVRLPLGYRQQAIDLTA